MHTLVATFVRKMYTMYSDKDRLLEEILQSLPMYGSLLWWSVNTDCTIAEDRQT